MLGERLAPCWCYSSIHLDERKKVHSSRFGQTKRDTEHVCLFSVVSVACCGRVVYFCMLVWVAETNCDACCLSSTNQH